MDEVLGDLMRVMAKVAEGDFSEKPMQRDGTDPVSLFAVAFRFLIDDLERAHVERQGEIARLRSVDEMKTRFINLAAHELNTPLTPIRIHLHLLGGGDVSKLNPTQRNAIQALDRNMSRLSRSVGDLLDVARLQSQHFRIYPAPLDLAALVRTVVADVRPAADARRITLDETLPDTLPITADPDRVTQVLHNLLINATKYTRPGGHIQVTLIDVEDRALVSVTDTGIGLTRTQLDQLFRPFIQVHADRDEATEGTGLGLYITKGIIEAHGGRIWADSDGAGKGARFTFLLPKTRGMGSAEAPR